LVAEYDVFWREPTGVIEARKELLLATGHALIERLGPSNGGAAPLPTSFGDWSYLSYGDRTTGLHASAVVYGDLSRLNVSPGEIIPVRIQSCCTPCEMFDANVFGDPENIQAFMSLVHDSGRTGIVIRLEHDGRGHGFVGFTNQLNREFAWQGGRLEWACDPSERRSGIHDHGKDRRDFAVAAEILQDIARHIGTNVSFDIQTANRLKLDSVNRHLNRNPARNPEMLADETRSPELQQRRIEAATMLVSDMRTEWHRPWETVATRRELLQKQGLPLVSEIGRGPLPTKRFGDWTLVAFGDYTTGETHLLLVYGELHSVLDGSSVYDVRVHSSCRTNHNFEALNCECKPELQETMRRFHQIGQGVIAYMDQEGRGTGVHGKLHQLQAMFGWEGGKIIQNTHPDGRRVTTVDGYRMHNFPDEARDFSAAGAMLQHIGVQTIRLHSNNPRKRKGLEDYNIVVLGQEKVVCSEVIKKNPIIEEDLRAKRDHLGHIFELHELGGR